VKNKEKLLLWIEGLENLVTLYTPSTNLHSFWRNN